MHKIIQLDMDGLYLFVIVLTVLGAMWTSTAKFPTNNKHAGRIFTVEDHGTLMLGNATNLAQALSYNPINMVNYNSVRGNSTDIVGQFINAHQPKLTSDYSRTSN
jgi:hypothetical protein